MIHNAWIDTENHELVAHWTEAWEKRLDERRFRIKINQVLQLVDVSKKGGKIWFNMYQVEFEMQRIFCQVIVKDADGFGHLIVKESRQFELYETSIWGWLQWHSISLHCNLVVPYHNCKLCYTMILGLIGQALIANWECCSISQTMRSNCIKWV